MCVIHAGKNNDNTQKKKVCTLDGKETLKDCMPKEIWRACRKWKLFHQEMKTAFFLQVSILFNSFLFAFFMWGEGENNSRMGNVGNAKMQKDEAWKQVEEKIYLDYLKLNMRNKWKMLAYS